jgi:hypothetical protein
MAVIIGTEPEGHRPSYQPPRSRTWTASSSSSSSSSSRRHRGSCCRFDSFCFYRCRRRSTTNGPGNASVRSRQGEESTTTAATAEGGTGWTR